MNHKSMWVWFDRQGEVEGIHVQDDEPTWNTKNRFASSYHRLRRDDTVFHVLGINGRLSQAEAIKHAKVYCQQPDKWLKIVLGEW